MSLRKYLIKILPGAHLRHLIYTTAWPKIWQVNKRVYEQYAWYEPFKENKCIFIHVPKTGGKSVDTGIFNHLDCAHVTSREYKEILGPKRFKKYFKFAFVRNPWERTFSAYNFLITGGLTTFDKQWGETFLSEYGSFNKFVKIWLNNNNIWNEIHFYPQTYFLRLPFNKKIQVDFVGRFENLQEDYNYVQKQIFGEIRHELPHKNPTKYKVKSDYREHYDDEMREIVAKVYKDDIETFGYTFDG